MKTRQKHNQAKHFAGDRKFPIKRPAGSDQKQSSKEFRAILNCAVRFHNRSAKIICRPRRQKCLPPYPPLPSRFSCPNCAFLCNCVLFPPLSSSFLLHSLFLLLPSFLSVPSSFLPSSFSFFFFFFCFFCFCFFFFSFLFFPSPL